MNKDILVAILEDDIFSQNWMALLLVRDWRTRVVAEFKTRIELCDFLDNQFQPFDILVMDVDLFGEIYSAKDICEILTEKNSKSKILLTGVKADPKIVKYLDDERIAGYVLKEEVGYSLSWMISFAFDGHWIFTPGTFSLAVDLKPKLPDDYLVLDGRKKIPGFTDHESEVARLAFIFSLGRRDLADELKISEQWSYGMVSELYKKMGLIDILSGEEELFSYIGENPIIRSHFEQVMATIGTSKKARDLETLAYHLITMPQIVD
jgi:DNA-binding NarL/FixJ family response regulator